MSEYSTSSSCAAPLSHSESPPFQQFIPLSPALWVEPGGSASPLEPIAPAPELELLPSAHQIEPCPSAPPLELMAPAAQLEFLPPALQREPCPSAPLLEHIVPAAQLELLSQTPLLELLAPAAQLGHPSLTPLLELFSPAPPSPVEHLHLASGLQLVPLAQQLALLSTRPRSFHAKISSSLRSTI